MDITDFEDKIDVQILQRGLDYFQKGNVVSLEEIDKGLWYAEVTGSDDYKVKVRTYESRIQGWECDCPYELGLVCKHIVAVFYSIAENLNIEKKPLSEKITRKKDYAVKIKNIFNAVSKEELQDFITTQFRKDKSLKNSFIAFFSDLLEEEPEEKYQTIFDNLFKAAAGRKSYIDYFGSSSFSYSLNELEEKAQKLFDSGKLKESLIICKTLIENISEKINDVDDHEGDLTTILENTFGIFSDIASSVPPMMKDELFDYCIKEFKKQKYHDFGFDDNFLYLISQLVSTEEQEKDYINIIDEQLEIEKKKNEFSDYSVVKLLRHKLDYFKKRNISEEINKIVEENISYSKIREMAIDYAIDEKDFEKAKMLCKEGIAIHGKDRFNYSSEKWKMKLLKISEMEKNIPDIRKWSETIFFENYEMDYYRKLKSTYDNNDWGEICEKIINRIKGKKNSGSVWEAYTLAKIFVEENYIERLLTLVQINSNHLEFVDSYAKYLRDKYPNEIIEYYSKAIVIHAEVTDRKVYEEVAMYMKKMSRINGSEKELNRLLTYFRATYKKRKAMMEILNKKFGN